MEDLVDTITRGNVPQVKTVLTSVVTALAVYQVAMMAVGYRKVKLPFLKPKAASFAHRSVGDAIFPLTVLVGWMCWAYFGIEDGIEHAADGESTRAAIHVIAGTLLIAVLVLKVVVVRWWTRLERYLPHLGLAVLALFLLTWVTSAGDYLVSG
jgi:Ca2+/Na+ antiporter